MNPRAVFRCLVLSFAALACGPVSAAWPERPLKIVVGFTPGGTADSVGRLLAGALAPRLGQNVVVENRAGANGNLATEYVGRAAPDGYTVFFTSIGHVVNPLMMKDAQYDPVAGFTPIGQVLAAPNMLVVPASSPFQSVGELVAYARAHPGRLNVASSGTGTSVHLSAELFMQMTGVELTHIPYKGTGSALPDLLAGTVSMMFPNLPSALPLAQSGKLRALGVTTRTRSASAPQVPAIAEAGVPGYDMSTWYGLVGPARMPPDIVARLNQELRAVLSEPAMRDRLAAQGADVVTGSAEDFARFIQEETRKWARLIRQARITVQ
jgi:tripartite-type tricarboxylate transporter receptor subunit TctC